MDIRSAEHCGGRANHCGRVILKISGAIQRNQPKMKTNKTDSESSAGTLVYNDNEFLTLQSIHRSATTVLLPAALPGHQQPAVQQWHATLNGNCTSAPRAHGDEYPAPLSPVIDHKSRLLHRTFAS